MNTFTTYIEPGQDFLGRVQVADQLSHGQRQLFDERRDGEYFLFCRQLRVFLEVDDLDLTAIFQVLVANVPQIIDRVLRGLGLAGDIQSQFPDFLDIDRPATKSSIDEKYLS